MTETLERLEIVLHIGERPDGGIRVLSDDVQGLFLGGSDRQRIWGLVGPTLEHLLRMNGKLNVVRVMGPLTAPSTGDVVVEVEHRAAAHRSAA